MSSLDFLDVAKLINYSRTTEIDIEPLKSSGRWSLHLGRHKVHTSTYKFVVVYIQAAATILDLEAAGREIAELPDAHVVFPSTLSRTMLARPDIKRLLKNAKGVWTTKEYIVSFIKDELQVYLENLRAIEPRFYVDPRVGTPSGIPIKTPNPLRSFLCDPDSSSSMLGGKLAILLAEPGQGKTYMSRHLVSSLATTGSGIVPLMVDSSQWHTLSLQDQGSLLKTIAHSFRHFNAAIGWLDGHEEEFLKATLKADVFRIVFDGFDEYLLRNRDIQPMQVLEALAGLANTTGTRIIITSRTSFWNTNLPEAALHQFVERTRSLSYIIQPFDLGQAKSYFQSRLKTERENQYATEVYSVLNRGNRALVGRGFVLSLIADLAEKAAATQTFKAPDSNALMWLIGALCEREVLRQQLPFGPAEQLAILSTFATEAAMGTPADNDLLEYAMVEANPAIDTAARKGIIEKVKSHPLLEYSKSSGLWRFKQEQVAILLIANRLIGWEDDEITRFIGQATLDATTRQDIASTIVALVRDQPTESDSVDQLRVMCRALRLSQERVSTKEGSKLAAMIALIAVEQMLPSGRGRTVRTKLLLRLCGESGLTKLCFVGTIAGFDFRGIVFDHCWFEGVTWANCQFSDATIFRGCHIIGGAAPAHCESFGSIKVVDCALDPEADAVLNSVRVKEGKRKYSSEDLRSDLIGVLNKFVTKGGAGLKSISEDALRRGPIGSSRYCDEIIEVAISMILERHSISGGLHGLHVRDDAAEAVKFYAANNVFTGRLREALEKLEAKLQLD